MSKLSLTCKKPSLTLDFNNGWRLHHEMEAGKSFLTWCLENDYMEIFKTNYFLVSEKCLLEKCVIKNEETKVYMIILNNEEMIKQLHKIYVEDQEEKYMVIVTNKEILDYIENSKYKKELKEIFA